MDATALAALLRQLVPAADVELVPSVDRQTTVYAAASQVPALLRTLRDHPELEFAFLAELTAVDVWPREPRFEVIYVLVSLAHRLRLRVKVRIHGGDAHLESVCDIWPAANWLEREVWDLFGIAFDGHPDPRRLLMPEDWEGYPLRKDYPVQIRKTPTAAEPLQVTAEEFRANVARDRLTRER
jgi:NADH-quinone oxidoreductase subunit C